MEALSQYLVPRASRPIPYIQVTFRQRDIPWFRGYATCWWPSEIALAYDEHDLFDCAAHLFFKRVPRRRTIFCLNRKATTPCTRWYVDVVDPIAMVHQIRFRSNDAARMKAALGHLQQNSWRSAVKRKGGAENRQRSRVAPQLQPERRARHHGDEPRWCRGRIRGCLGGAAGETPCPLLARRATSRSVNPHNSVH